MVVQAQVGQLVCSAPPMFMMAVKETLQPVTEKRGALEDAPLPPVAMHQMVPLEGKRQRGVQKSFG